MSSTKQGLDADKLFLSLRADGILLTHEQMREIRNNDAQTLFEVAQELIELGKYAKGLTWLRKAAAQNHSEAQNEIGFMYGEGYGVKQNYREALEWYIKALDNGYLSAAFEIGEMYYEGKEGVPRNIHKAIDYFKVAVNSDCHMNAKYYLGSIYSNYAVDVQQATNWYKKAGDSGHPIGVQKVLEYKEAGYFPQVDTDTEEKSSQSRSKSKPTITYTPWDVHLMKSNLSKMADNHKHRRGKLEAENKEFQKKFDTYERERVEKEKLLQKRIDTLEQEKLKQKAAIEQRIAALEQDKSERETALLEELNNAKEERKKMESDIQQLNEIFAKFKSVLL